MRIAGAALLLTIVAVLGASVLVTGGGASRAAQLIDQVRGAEKLDQTRDRLKRLLVKKARLEADRDGAEQISVPNRLKELAGRVEIPISVDTTKAAVAAAALEAGAGIINDVSGLTLDPEMPAVSGKLPASRTLGLLTSGTLVPSV